MRRWVAAFLWSTLILPLPACETACALHDLNKQWDRLHPIAPKPSDSPAPSILLRVMPHTCLAPCEVRLTVLIKDPGQVLNCPSFSVDHGNGSVSSSEQACPPSEPFQLGYALRLKNETYREGGAYVIKVSVFVDGKVVLSESSGVLVVGADDDPNSRDASL